MSLIEPSTIPPISLNTNAPFRPRPANDFHAAGLNATVVEGLILKFLLVSGNASGRRIADELGLPFGPFPEFLRHLKNQQILTYTNDASANDYYYALTDSGRARARNFFEECAYVGTAPVPFDVYVDSVESQTITAEQPKMADLRRAFSDLLLNEEMFQTLGSAINSGRGMFIYGFAGNGKTSIAERITRCFGSTIWIPRVISVDGQILKLYDPATHEAIRPRGGGLLRSDDQDDRWIEIMRPTLIAGGELTMDNLEIRYNAETKISEAPLQMKSNNGTFLIDDFGRQRMPPMELLNRWIIPLEKRYDFLTLASGKKIRVPFDQLILFSTNLEPKHLVDEAFLRRIPYKVNVTDPTEPMFRQMFEVFGPRLGFKSIDQDAITYLINTHYRAVNRPFRACQPRDLLLQVKNHCVFNELPIELTHEYLDIAVGNYFTVM